MTRTPESRTAWSTALEGMRVTKPTYKISLLWTVLDWIDLGRASAESIPDTQELSRSFDRVLDHHGELKRRGAIAMPRQHLSVESSEETSDRIWVVEAGCIRPLLPFRPVLAEKKGRDWLRAEIIQWAQKRDDPACLRFVEMAERAGQPWTDEETRLCSRIYLEMLEAELQGTPYSKAEYRRRFRKHYPYRSESSVEFKLANISAVLEELDLPTISGYCPRRHYQKGLAPAVLDELHNPGSRAILDRAARAAPTIAPVPNQPDYPSLLVDAPAGESEVHESVHTRISFPDFARLDAANRELGKAGEELVVDYERWRLGSEGRSDLATKIEWVSQTRGDGAGFDLLSFDAVTEEEVYIEVKTTTLGPKSRFFASSNEVRFSEIHSASFLLCRVFHFRRGPKMFHLPGSLHQSCSLAPRTYSCRPL
jgi:hypothetical protein